MDSAVVIRSALVQGRCQKLGPGREWSPTRDPMADAAETRAKASAVLETLGVVA
ncbi:MAG: hypothetical protein H0W65_08835 [Sphingomonas sp.]|uniref:hypothetical protein n=1 Tax=Sphingomonas sp. TaxID=28214 RepID=UPI0017F401AD|nr:hypothetical protein [Sphingomonas sp.]MBA3667813.1 hypothetical protein [Sphingomonas sp.]